MTTPSDAEIQQYLASVDHAAAELCLARRVDFLDGLRERIETARAGREGEVSDALSELGEPRSVAVAAFSANSTRLEAPRRKGTPRTVMALWTVSTALGVLMHLPDTGVLAVPAGCLLVVAFAALWRSGWWSVEHKVLATAGLCLPNFVVGAYATIAGSGTAVTLIGHLFELAIRCCVLGWLWEQRTS